MKQSTIAEAIEEGRNPVVYEYRISGHSDDILQVEGPGVDAEFYFCDQILHGNTINVMVHDSEGATFYIKAGLFGGSQWMIGINPSDDDAPLPIGTYELSVQGYTAVLTIKTPKHLAFTGYKGAD